MVLPIEPLEHRRHLAAFASLASTGTLQITGTRAPDVIVIDLDGDRIIARQNDSRISFARSNVKRIAVDAGSGNDRVFNRTPLRSTLNGGAGDDQLTGGKHADLLNGGRGADHLLPLGGGNVIFADVADQLDYTGLSGRQFDVLVTPGAADETIAAIRHFGNVDRFVCIDGLNLNLRLTKGNDQLELFVDGNDYYNGIATRIDMADGNDTLLRALDVGNSTTVLGGTGNDRFFAIDDSDFNGVGTIDTGPGDDYAEWNNWYGRPISFGEGIDTVRVLSQNTNTGGPFVEVRADAERIIPNTEMVYLYSNGNPYYPTDRPDNWVLDELPKPIVAAQRTIANAPTATITPGGTLMAFGNSSSERIELTQDNSAIKLRIGDKVQRFDRAAIKQIWIGGLDGNDRIINRTDLPAVLCGDAGNDTISGGEGGGRLLSGFGNDTLRPTSASAATQMRIINDEFLNEADLVDYRESTTQSFRVFAISDNPVLGALLIERDSIEDRAEFLGSAYGMDLRLTDRADQLTAFGSGYEGSGGITTIDMAGGVDDTAEIEEDDFMSIFIVGRP